MVRELSLRCPPQIHRHHMKRASFKGKGNERVIKMRRTQMIPYSWGINHSKLKVTTGRLVQCWLESPLYSLLVAGPRLISHLLAPISQSVTLPATWNLQLHLGLLKKARQPKWRRCSQWRLTCPVACCKIGGSGGEGGDITLLSSPSDTANTRLSLPNP